MIPESISGKAARTYRSRLRRQQAEATRTRVVAAAAELFAAEGYARTTLAKIAAAAGVSTETVQGQGPKAALLIAAGEQAAFGVPGEANILDLDVGRTLLGTDDFDAALDVIVTAQTDAHVGISPLAPALFGGASIDAELDRYLGRLLADITLQIRRVLGVFRGRGWVRTDLPFDEIVETVVVIASIETFLRMTQRDGWSPDGYRGWLRRMLIETVFLPPQRN